MPGLPGVAARIELSWRPGPFTVDVAPDGRPRTRLILTAQGLPPPGSLGGYRGFVAWIAPPTMDSVMRLGPVANGRTALGTTELEKFTILVSAERDVRAREPAGRIVLRGQSPATRLFPPDLMQFSIGAMLPHPATTGAMSGMHDGMPTDTALNTTAVTTADTAVARWTTVPMPHGLTMLPAEMALTPDAEAWLPPPSAPPLRAHQAVRLASGDTLRLEAGLVRRSLAGRPLTMFAFNGQQPGPLIEVRRGAEITVVLTNRLPQPTTVHWHGVRLDNANDGIPDLTQPPVPPGGEFTYRLRFPTRGSTGITPTSARTCSGDWVSTATSWCDPPRAAATGRPTGRPS